ncbi:methylenetetrahydromethanopterin dehydrogenase [Candidatus Methylospira mobilis]|uniref:Methylenetetrahydromethanopterin dehydrogenase n=1 Tax=Candidatus Methylospira mobilis TaxID=1808979 RepID=A0A5Q0BNK9_9GAMM|nr:NAD(P)-dependent methylenetetrahydromethanopterin dehydrogenase [Candidatus Methylospira mobilis]QFY43688.1 methylenetetrahydromethanopterin dehydrogenase [Candidatus Methylospira mobilis]WNV04678.1 NAD(P)-dependent methylenetetrahydromethanopterin dehydrogenase [Candidatus Methylospira mobilis]
MEKRSIIHLFDPMPHTSPFDLNMAADAGFEVLLPYSNVDINEINGLIQDAIFSRGPSGVKRTGIFIGGRDIGLALDMLATAKKAMVPPFEVSILADPSGAFTTAAALVACVEHQLKQKHNTELSGLRAVVFGGTGPVGLATAVIASLAGAVTLISDHLSVDTALQKADEYNRRCGSSLEGTYAGSEADKARLISTADIVFCTARAGIEVLGASVQADAHQLKVAGDVNAVPPLGIKGIKLKDNGAPLQYAINSPGSVGIGALAVGDIKYQLQHHLLTQMLNTDKPVYLDFRDAFEQARILVKQL